MWQSRLCGRVNTGEVRRNGQRHREEKTMRNTSSLAITALFFAMTAVLAILTPAQAQVEKLPVDLQETLARIGPTFQKDVRKAIPATIQAFQPVLKAAPKDGVTVVRDQAYGEHPRQILDVYQPTAQNGAPVVIFVHGGAYVAGDKDGAGEAYGNVALWFARQGMLGINATYPLAPAAKWPSGAKSVGAMVAWATANAMRFGGDPNRIILIGHSAGATHVAGYVFDKSLQPSGGPRIAGAVLISGRYRINFNPADPNGRNMQAYFGDDASRYADRSPITHIRDGLPVPVFVVIAQYDNPGLDVTGAQLFSALCERDGVCPRFVRLNQHNHLSEVLAFNTPDEYLGREILDFIARGR
jgi:acetyl esterase/lipase